jgi:Xaa-Pro dipeptidase
MQPAARLYRPHIQALSARYDAALESTEFDAVLIGAGVPPPVHRDDQEYPYRPEPLFLQWAALEAHPGSALLYRPARKPLLLVYEPEDFWHQAAPIPKGPWQQALDIRIVRKRAELTRHLPKGRRGKPAVALLGDPAQWRGLSLSGTVNPKPLLTHLDYDRAFKLPRPWAWQGTGPSARPLPPAAASTRWVSCSSPPVASGTRSCPTPPSSR